MAKNKHLSIYWPMSASLFLRIWYPYEKKFDVWCNCILNIDTITISVVLLTLQTELLYFPSFLLPSISAHHIQFFPHSWCIMFLYKQWFYENYVILWTPASIILKFAITLEFMLFTSQTHTLCNFNDMTYFVQILGKYNSKALLELFSISRKQPKVSNIWKYQ